MAFWEKMWYTAVQSHRKEGRAVQFDKTLVKEKLLSWDSLLAGYDLPKWEDFPSLPLYMDQVIYLLNQYLSLLPLQEGEERLVTPAMINNYVKLKIIPAPVKKRYGRAHMAYLVMVCVLKQVISTSDIRKVLPLELDEEGVRHLYELFGSTFRESKEDFQSKARAVASPIFEAADRPVTDLIFRMAAEANLSKLLTQQVIRLHPEMQTQEEKK